MANNPALFPRPQYGSGPLGNLGAPAAAPIGAAAGGPPGQPNLDRPLTVRDLLDLKAPEAMLHPYIREALRQGQVTKYGIVNTRPFLATEEAIISSTITTATVNPGVQVPGNELWIVREVRGYHNFNDPQNNNGLAGALTPGAIMNFDDWKTMVADNVLFTVKRAEQSQDITLDAPMQLSQLLGNRPALNFAAETPGWILKPRDTLKISFAWAVSSWLLAGHASTVGLTFCGTALQLD